MVASLTRSVPFGKTVPLRQGHLDGSKGLLSTWREGPIAISHTQVSKPYCVHLHPF